MAKKLEEEVHVFLLHAKAVEVPKRYGGNYVIIVEKEVVAHGETREQAVKAYNGNDDFFCMYVMTDEEMKEAYKRVASNTFGLQLDN